MSGANQDAQSTRLLIISPCRDEEAFVAKTVASVFGQTVTPDRWIIVDDGSTDGTARILAELTESVPWAEVVTIPPRAQRVVGGAVIAAVYAGLAHVELAEYDFVFKLDMDLVLPPRYIETCLEAFAEDPRLGSFSGKVFYRLGDGAVVSERIGDDVSVGALKLYRVAAFRQIGGLVRSVMWDGIDCHRMRMMGWRVRSSGGGALEVEHLRPMGSSDSGVVRGRVRWGRGQYYMGTGFAWIVVSSAYRMLRPPVLIGGAAILWGYLSSMLTRAERLDDQRFRAFLRSYHKLCMLHGKRYAVDATERQQETVWNPDVAGPWGDPLNLDTELSAR